MAPSGDGSLIAFESLATADPLDTGHRVFLMNRDGSGVQQVTSRDVAEDRFPVISSDGTKIAFLSQRNTANNTRQVFTVNVDGSNLQPVTQEVCNPGCSVVTAVAWSPDSTQLAFGCFNCGLSCPFPNEGIKIINADGTGESQLACGRNGAPGAIDWSSDGTHIAFEDAFGLAGRDGMGISQVGPDGTRLGDITPDQLGRSPGGVGGLDATGPGAFRYSPDSTMLAYAIDATTGGPQGISLINLDGTGKQDVINDRNFHHISWPPGPAILSPAALTLSPDPLVGGPNFPQQLSPVLKDTVGNILSRSALGYCVGDGRFAHSDQLGLVTFSRNPVPSTPMVVTNGGLVSNTITAIPHTTDPPVSFYPATWDFGNQAVGTTSATQTFTLINTGSAPLNVNAITLIGANAADYALDPSSTCPLGGGGPLNPGDRCTVLVTSSPSDAGTRVAQINVDDDASGSPQGIPLTATGIAPASPRSSRSPRTP